MHGNYETHTQQASSEKFILFAANAFIANEVAGYMAARAIPFKSCLGKWKGVYENSWLVNSRHESEVEHFWRKEECIMRLGIADGDKNRPVVFEYMIGKPSESMGKLVEVSEAEYLESDGGTASYNDLGKIVYYLIK
jgi:hypothetical protein